MTDHASTVPLVLFAYRRPDIVAQTLAALKADGVPLLLVYSDAAKGEQDRREVEDVRAMVEAIDWCERRITLRADNHGLGKSVLAGMTEVFEKHEAAIVYEDDLVCVPGTYAYLAAALSAYRDDSRVMSLTAWTHPAITPAAIGRRPYFDGKAECWAWAAWRRSWRGMGADPMDMVREALARGMDVAKYGPDMPVMASEAKRRNLWAIGWWYLHMLKGGLCMRPPHSMVEHLGWDERGTTTLEAMRFWANPSLQAAPPIPTVWPDPAEHPEVPALWRNAIHASALQEFPSLEDILA